MHVAQGMWTCAEMCQSNAGLNNDGPPNGKIYKLAHIQHNILKLLLSIVHNTLPADFKRMVQSTSKIKMATALNYPARKAVPLKYRVRQKSAYKH